MNGTKFARGPKASAAPRDEGNDIAADRLNGATEIAEFWFGRGDEVARKATFTLLEKGRIPAGKVGGRWVASRRALRRKHEQLTGLADQAAK